MYTEKGTFGTLESKETTKEKGSRKIFQSETKKKNLSFFSDYCILCCKSVCGK